MARAEGGPGVLKGLQVLGGTECLDGQLPPVNTFRSESPNDHLACRPRGEQKDYDRAQKSSSKLAIRGL
jgi:hypothetical protein